METSESRETSVFKIADCQWLLKFISYLAPMVKSL